MSILFTNNDLLEYVTENLSSKYCFVLYDLLEELKECTTDGIKSNPPSFSFNYKNHYLFVGKNALKYLKHLPKYEKRVFVSFEPEIFPQVKQYFKNFVISDKVGEGNFNKFFTLSCNKEEFYSKITNQTFTKKEVSLLKTDDWSKNVPNYVKTFLDDDSIMFGIKKQDKIVAVAPAPNIYIGNKVTNFAIIRGVWTSPEYRNKSYSTIVLKTLCKYLFEKKGIKNIYLWVEQNNPAALRVYQKIGFKIDDQWYGALCEFR